jgi:hypothetical protein
MEHQSYDVPGDVAEKYRIRGYRLGYEAENLVMQLRRREAFHLYASLKSLLSSLRKKGLNDLAKEVAEQALHGKMMSRHAMSSWDGHLDDRTPAEKRGNAAWVRSTGHTLAKLYREHDRIFGKNYGGEKYVHDPSRRKKPLTRKRPKKTARKRQATKKRSVKRKDRKTQAWVQKKVRLLMKEGYPRLQSFAIAYRMAGIPRPRQPVKHLTPKERRQSLKARRRALAKKKKTKKTRRRVGAKR